MTKQDDDRECLLEVVNLSKHYGGVRALHEVNLQVNAGEIVGLIGDNGAGKTTLIKCVSGTTQPTTGKIFIGGVERQISDQQTAREYGIETVHQDLALVEEFDVSENLFLNREIVSDTWPFRWLGWLTKKAMRDECSRILSELEIDIPIRQRITSLSGGQRQAVAVGRAVGWGRRIVLMDEPTAALGVEQAEHVLALARRLRGQGVGILFISHNMQHVVEVCDRIVVLLQGEKVADLLGDDVSPRDLVDHMTGAASRTS